MYSRFASCVKSPRRAAKIIIISVSDYASSLSDRHSLPLLAFAHIRNILLQQRLRPQMNAILYCSHIVLRAFLRRCGTGREVSASIRIEHAVFARRSSPVPSAASPVCERCVYFSLFQRYSSIVSSLRSIHSRSQIIAQINKIELLGSNPKYFPTLFGNTSSKYVRAYTTRE